MAQLLVHYFNYLLASGMASSTVKVYESKLRAIDIPLLAVDTAYLEAFLAIRRSHGMKPETLKSYRSAFRSFYQWANQRGILQTDPSEHLRGIHIPKTVPLLAPDDAVQYGLIAAPIDEQQMILAGRMGCLRLSELTNLHMRDRVGEVFRVTGKGGKTRNVPINETWMPVVLKLERQLAHGFYLPGRYGGALHIATVSKKIRTRTGFNPHALRHAGATAAYKATRDLRAVQELLGHESLATTERYLHTDMDAITRAAAGTAFRGTIADPHAVGRLWEPLRQLHHAA